MKLILSSCDFLNDKSNKVILDNLPKPIGECKVLFIPNENSNKESIRNGKYQGWLVRDGFSAENCFVFDKEEPDKFKNLDIDCLFISGGNTFLILDSLRKCGFDKDIIRYVKNGVTYIGGSAGAHIVTGDISHVAKYDEPPEGFDEYRGLGLADVKLICHFDDLREADCKELSKDGAVIALSNEDSIVITDKINGEIHNISAVLRSIAVGSCSIALAGSRAYGGADEDSDIDIYMLVDEAKPHDEIVEIIKTVADKDTDVSVSASFDFAPYGGGIEFTYHGVPVEVTVKYYSMIKRRLDDCLEGKFEIIPQTWTSNGYYTYIAASEIDFIEPIWDPNGFIAAYKEKFKEYPEKLIQSIISCFMGRAYTWINNFHYESAIRRGDFMFTSACVLHTVQDLIQVIFAINRVYFKGDKKLADSLQELPYCPKEFSDNLLFLMQSSDDSELLQKQYEILRDAIRELNERLEK